MVVKRRPAPTKKKTFKKRRTLTGTSYDNIQWPLEAFGLKKEFSEIDLER